LSYDGYTYFGGDSDAGRRLTAFATSVREAYDRDGQLPKLDLRLLRATLFIEQRIWCKSSGPPIDERSARYLTDCFVRSARTSDLISQRRRARRRGASRPACASLEVEQCPSPQPQLLQPHPRPIDATCS
jgi:hypothetical protein